MARKLAGPGIALLLGLGFTVMGWTSPIVGGLLIAISILWALSLLPPIAHRLPSVSLERGGRSDGVAVRLRPPEAQGVKRLHRDTMELVAEMRGHWSSQPVPWLQSSREHSETIRAMDAASTEDERDRIWHESTERMMERSTREQQQLSALFGDRMRYVLGEYQRRGMIDRSEARHVEWLAQSKGWLPEAANTLGALARRL